MPKPQGTAYTSVHPGLRFLVPSSRDSTTKPSCLSEGSLADLFANQSPHLPSTLVSHLLEKPGGPTAVFTADLKLSITQAASFACPSILSPVEGAGLGAHSALLSLSPAGINFPHSWLANPSWVELPTPFLCTDGCFWMNGPLVPPFLWSLQRCTPIFRPTPAGPDLRAGPPEHPPGDQG